MFGLLGPNGAGKTTTIRVLNTLLPVQEGGQVFGHDVRRETMEVRRLFGYVPQQLSIEAALTGRENVSWFARLYDVPRRERGQRVAEALEAMGLPDAADRLAGTFSGGMVRRLELAQALVNRPALLVLDEPTVGLDPIARDRVWERVEEMRPATGMTVLVTTHYMEEADAMCDRVAMMDLGGIRAEGSPDELKAGLGDEGTYEVKPGCPRSSHRNARESAAGFWCAAGGCRRRCRHRVVADRSAGPLNRASSGLSRSPLDLNDKPDGTALPLIEEFGQLGSL